MGPKRFEESANGQQLQCVHQHFYADLASDGELLENVKFIWGEIVVKPQRSCNNCTSVFTPNYFTWQNDNWLTKAQQVKRLNLTSLHN